MSMIAVARAFAGAGSSCWSKMDVGVAECSFQPVRFDDHCMGQRTASVPSSRAEVQGKRNNKPPAHPWLTDPLGCHDPLSAAEHHVCCVPEDGRSGFSLFAPCMVCAARPASIVEVPCGHITVCTECYGDYHTNVRCLRCRDQVAGRVDVSPFICPVTGRPNECNMCKTAVACVVTIPCVHMCFCANCLPMSPAGCPTCGGRVERTCHVKWSSSSAAPTARTARTARGFTSLPATVGSVTHTSRNDLAETTEDVDQEIHRLEQQLRRLRNLSHSSIQSSSNPQECRHLPTPPRGPWKSPTAIS